MSYKETPEEVQRLLKEIVTHFDKEDRQIRERQIRTWRRLKLFWEGFQKAWYSEVAHDWRIWDEVQTDDTQQSYYDKPINVFRAYLESIIAALSVTIPPIKCFPDDADNTLDLATAKAGDKIAELIYKHNNVSLLWLHALFIYMTEGMVACYNYPESNEHFGMYAEEEKDEVEEEHEIVSCPKCGYTLEDKEVNHELGELREEKQEQNQEDEFTSVLKRGPEDYDVEMCPACGETTQPEISKESFLVTRLVGVTHKPKTRILMDCFGGLYVKIPIYARKQTDCPYLILSYETHYANAIEKYEHLHGTFSGKEGAKKIAASVGPKDPYEQWGRLSPQYQGAYPTNNVTIRSAWLRPAAFNVLQDENDVKKLKKLYPNGCKVTLVNDEFGDASNERLDDSWTLTYNPLSDYLHHDPLGLLLVSIQEITNDIISLTLQTMEHGIGQTFADPAVLNFNAYRQMESVPGGIYEATPKTGKSIGDAFHEIKTANLSPEVQPFAQNIQSLAQLVSGALPSLFGGQVEQGSGTASEYSMSRAQALQRLQNVWKIFTMWWKDIFGKAIPAYIQEVKEDERNVQQTKDGNFINVFIRKAELEGKIGDIELEASESLPLTWSQKKDMIMQLLQAANPQILNILGAPENLPAIRNAIGLVDFFIPGEDDKDKQYDEIKLLVNSEPMPTGDPMNPEAPSVDVDMQFDNHQIEYEICRKWAISEAGRQTKIDNEPGYRNVLLHGKAHYMIMNPPQQMVPGQGGAPNPEIPTEQEMNPQAPIQGESDVPTRQQ
jgi:ssDNA-binding Zn-finger/Zn-ribbon topoisomerase 1